VLYKLFICALVAMVPLTGIRMICVDASGRRAAKVAATADGCEEVCSRRKPVAPAEPPGCVLVADSCSLLLPGIIAVAPTHPPMVFLLVLQRLAPLAHGLYRPPSLAHDSPPPKA
jgi:hypothetical protein